MRIDKNNTQWIFMLTSSLKPEDRHLNDIIFGVKILLKKNVSLKNMSFIIEDSKSKIIQKMAPLINASTPIYTYTDMPKLLSSLNVDNIIITVTGHGNIDGIGSSPQIKPHPFLDIIKQQAKASNVLLLLGQCYAGIFDRLRVTKRVKKDGTHTPHIIIIGATKIATSISVPSEYDNISWDANIMLSAFFQWIDQPIDIDGDTLYSIVDAFKYITYMINTQCYQIEKQQYIQTIELIEQYKSLHKKLRESSALSLDDQITKDAIEKALTREFIHQEPWILNSCPALKIAINL